MDLASLILITAVLAALFALELIYPARPAARQRWPLNIALGAVNLLLVRLCAAFGPFALASIAASQGFGLLHQLHIDDALPAPIIAIIVILAMDLAIYWQHRASHRFGWLWAMHRLHHADADFDVTTGLRFHPGEALLSMLYKGAVGAALGAPPQVMLAFELYLTIGSMIEHGNIVLPTPLDRAIRRIWVTPAMHRIHHSATGDDHNHNYSFALSIWDHLFATYQQDGHGTRIGLPRG